jgi:hypothetical protein
LPLYLLPCFVPLSLVLARSLAGLQWRRPGIVLFAAWILLLLGLKYYLGAVFPSDKDARVFAARLEAILPGHPEHVMFIEDMARNGLNLYFDSDIRRLSFTPEPKAISDSSYDQTVAEALAQDGRGRIFVMKRNSEAGFLEAVRAAGRVPVRLGMLPESHARLEMEDGWFPIFRTRSEPNRPCTRWPGTFPSPARSVATSARGSSRRRSRPARISSRLSLPSRLPSRRSKSCARRGMLSPISAR